MHRLYGERERESTQYDHAHEIEREKKNNKKKTLQHGRTHLRLNFSVLRLRVFAYASSNVIMCGCYFFFLYKKNYFLLFFFSSLLHSVVWFANFFCCIYKIIWYMTWPSSALIMRTQFLCIHLYAFFRS